MDLHSLNYLHYGAPKVWYCVPPSHRTKMDAFVAKRLYAQHDRCKEFMRHKVLSHHCHSHSTKCQIFLNCCIVFMP